MEMHQARYFLAAAKHLNFTKAAQECSVSAPSLIRAIKLLELEFGGRLFNRESSRTHLTELGRIALPHLEQVLQESLDAKRKARDFLELKEATLKLGIMGTIGPSQFVELITNFRERYPNVILRIVDANARQLQTALLAGDLEAAIYCLPRRASARAHARHAAVQGAYGHRRVPQPRARHEEGDQGGAPFRRSLSRPRQLRVHGLRGPRIRRPADRWPHRLPERARRLDHRHGGGRHGLQLRAALLHRGVVVRPIIEPEFWRTVNLVTVRGRRHSPAVGALVREVMRTRWQGRQALALQEEARAQGPERPE
jgi:DNA-binding transcriptional LysR family regulator